MKLTGKAKEDFLKQYGNEEWEIDDIYLNALVIEFFDSVGYTIDRDSYNKKMIITNWVDGLETQIEIDCNYFEPFEQWWEEAILTANKLYNETN